MRSLRWFLPERWSAASAVVLDAELRVWVRHAQEPVESWSRIDHRSEEVEPLVLPAGFTLNRSLKNGGLGVFWPLAAETGGFEVGSGADSAPIPAFPVP